MKNGEEKTGSTDLLSELEDNAALRLRCTILEEEVQRLNLALQNIQQANDALFSKLDNDRETTGIPCSFCVTLLPKMAELQGTVEALKVAAKKVAASESTSTQQVPSILTSSIRENITDVYTRLQELLGESLEEAQEDSSLKQMSTEILKLLAQRHDYDKLLGKYKTLVTENITLMKRVIELENKSKFEVPGEEYKEKHYTTMSEECQTDALNKIATLTHQIKSLTLSNSAFKNELSVKTKSASAVQSKLENYIIMQQSYLPIRDKIEKFCEHTLYDDKEHARASNSLLLQNIRDTLAVITDQLFEVTSLFSRDDPAETQPALHQQPHSWGIANLINRYTQLKYINQKLQIEVETAKYKYQHKIREQQEIADAREKYIEELLEQISPSNTQDACGVNSHESPFPENIDEIKSFKDLRDLVKRLDDTKRAGVSLSISSLKQILADIESKFQITKNLITIISPLRDKSATESLANILRTLSSDYQSYKEPTLSPVGISEEIGDLIELNEQEYNTLKETVSGLIHILFYYSNTLAEQKLERENEDEATINADLYETEESSDMTVSKQLAGSVEEELPLEQTSKAVVSEAEEALLSDNDTSPSRQCPSESEKISDKSSTIKPTVLIRSLKKPTQQKRKISVRLSSPSSHTSSQNVIDSSSEDDFSKERHTTEGWKALDTEDIW